MRVALTHTTRLDYSADVVEAVMDMRVGPLSDAHQRWELYEIAVTPSASVRRYGDGFGNVAHLVTISRAHQYVEVITRGQVDVLLEDPFALPAGPARPLTPAELYDYLSPSALIPRFAELDALAVPHRPGVPQGAFETVQHLMTEVYRSFTYRKDVTTVATTVPEVLKGRTGVCQDFAHVLIGLCRAIDIPARYVSGYIVADQPRPVQRQSQSEGGRDDGAVQGQGQSLGGMTQTLGGMTQGQTLGHTAWQPPGLGTSGVVEGPNAPRRGTGASHAWVEAYTPTHGWRGFDPTNNLVASTSHVKMAIGRDYTDIPPSRGTFRGQADEHLTVEVVALPME